MPGIIDPRYSKAFFSSALLSWLSSIFNHWRRIAWKFSLADCPLWRFGWWRALRTFLCGLSLDFGVMKQGVYIYYKWISSLFPYIHKKTIPVLISWWRKSVIVFVHVMVGPEASSNKFDCTTFSHYFLVFPKNILCKGW